MVGWYRGKRWTLSFAGSNRGLSWWCETADGVGLSDAAAHQTAHPGSELLAAQCGTPEPGDQATVHHVFVREALSEVAERPHHTENDTVIISVRCAAAGVLIIKGAEDGAIRN